MVKRMSSKDAMVDAASLNSHKHSQEIYSNVEDLWRNFYSTTGFGPKNPDQLGVAIGNVSYWALGPIYPTWGFD